MASSRRPMSDYEVWRYIEKTSNPHMDMSWINDLLPKRRLVVEEGTMPEPLHPEVAALLLGPPGTGKGLVARGMTPLQYAVAKEVIEHKVLGHMAYVTKHQT